MFKLLVLAAAAWFLASCGSDSQEARQPPPPPATDKGWLVVRPLVDAYCGPCHNGQNQKPFDSGKRFAESRAGKRIESGEMPPTGPLDPVVKASMLAYLRP